MSLIKFNNFYFRYKGNDEYALKNINLELDSNRFILLAGETGSGKTTLIRCMNGLIPQFYAGFYKGNVEISGKNTIETTISQLSNDVGIVFQNPENQLIAMNVEHEIAFGLENLGTPRERIKEKIKEVVEITEIESILDKAPFEISGGEQQRVAIASILVLEPKVIVLDEPTANLDPLFAKKILNLLKKIQVQKKITIIISEHRMDLILPLVDEIILMKESEIISHGAKEKVINSNTFENLNINKPKIYSIFNELKNRDRFQYDIPASIQEAISILKTIK
ncbi:MAG: ABC transporter ATP-binding protein [Candidatus Lokiarchaeota archaeon]|nr:ABC transporter ATP-binding protein [Candidatus Lokiarchaeota archaeon]